ncbi:hypothetical protein ACWEQL_40140 [Kitasatospora sp. NPDC004240]
MRPWQPGPAGRRHVDAREDEVADGQVRIRRETVRLDVETLCGQRFVPLRPPPWPQVEVHRIGHTWGEPVRCTAEERSRWAAGERACLDRISRALEEIHRAHGGRRSRVDLYADSRSGHSPGPALGLPGLRRRGALRSRDAQLAFAAEVRAALVGYLPVRQEIERRQAELAAEAAAEREAAAAARRREEERVAAVVAAVAAHPFWRYRWVESGRTVLVDRADVTAGAVGVPPGGADAARRPAEGWDGGPMKALDLSVLLLGHLVRPGGAVTFRWSEEARRAVEEECREHDVDLTFRQWWSRVAHGDWEDGPHGPVPRPARTYDGGSSAGRGVGGTGTSGTGGCTGGHGFGGFGGY